MLNSISIVYQLIDYNSSTFKHFAVSTGICGVACPILLYALANSYIQLVDSRRVQPFWYSICYRRGVVLSLCNVCVSGVVNSLPKRQTNRICDGHEDLSSC